MTQLHLQEQIALELRKELAVLIFYSRCCETEALSRPGDAACVPLTNNFTITSSKIELNPCVCLVRRVFASVEALLFFFFLCLGGFGVF